LFSRAVWPFAEVFESLLFDAAVVCAADQTAICFRFVATYYFLHNYINPIPLECFHDPALAEECLGILSFARNLFLLRNIAAGNDDCVS